MHDEKPTKDLDLNLLSQDFYLLKISSHDFLCNLQALRSYRVPLGQRLIFKPLLSQQMWPQIPNWSCVHFHTANPDIILAFYTQEGGQQAGQFKHDTAVNRKPYK